MRKRALRRAEHRYTNVFRAMDVSFWELDFSPVNVMVQQILRSGVTDLGAYFGRQSRLRPRDDQHDPHHRRERPERGAVRARRQGGDTAPTWRSSGRRRVTRSMRERRRGLSGAGPITRRKRGSAP
ncbi:MAG: hypothetical protein WDN69_11895 [Aliidongia sp.]